jgi:hypothetical protein
VQAKAVVSMKGSDLAEEAVRVAELAEKRGITLRIMGACAVRVHCPRYRHLGEQLGRRLTDIDFMSYEKYMPKTESFFQEIGYQPRKFFSYQWGREAYKRQFFDDPANTMHIDVFFDELEMSHKINFRGRLELDFPTITLADLLLEKMQIVRINEKDIKDVIVLVREHSVVDNESREGINSKYIAKLLSNDWGFYYTVTTNLNRVRNFLKEYSAVSDDDRSHDDSEIGKLIDAIEGEPKSMGWKMRAKVGTRKKWYTDVDEAVLPGSPQGQH